METYIHFLHNISKAKFKSLLTVFRNKNVRDYKKAPGSINDLQQSVLEASGPGVFKFISEQLDLKRSFKNIIFSTNNRSYIDNVDFHDVRAIINFRPINIIKHINEHFSSVNTLLPDAGIYIGRLETYLERKLRFKRRFGKKGGQLIWYVDFIVNRVIPKVRPLKKLYAWITQRQTHVISQAEVLGRLVYNGFEIIDYCVIDGLFYFSVIKTGVPRNDPDPSYHPLIKLKRVGKGGKLINVYKFRTMHPYSEYLQDFVLKLNGYNEAGKPAKDFRVTRWGKLLRKTWLDEIPQIINVLNGTLKIVGVRPLSRVRFNQFPKEMQKLRIMEKPGCIPPYVSLCMPDADGNIEAEKIYLKEKEENPYTTDIKYFVKAVFNICFNKIRSA